MSGGFSSSGSGSNQAKEGLEDVQGSELSTGGKYSAGMSASGTINNQADDDCKNEDDVGGQHVNAVVNTKVLQRPNK